MKRILTVTLAALLMMSLLCTPALAKSVNVNGTVVSSGSESITASFGGTVEKVLVSAGDTVRAGDVLAYLETTKVYALEDGVVRFFGSVGDSAESVSARYGAVAYVEPEVQYTISATTKSAYDQEENKIIHPGESVYLRSAEDGRRTGTGMVTAVSGTSFTVEVMSGNFSTGESVYVFRGAEYTAVTRIGRGSIAHADPVAYTGEGVIAAFPAVSGSEVKKGDVIFETLEGSFSGQSGDLTAIIAPVDGVVASISLSKGEALASGSVVAELYADSALRIKATVSETDLSSFTVGVPVRIEFPFYDNGEYVIGGVIEKISRLGAANAAEEESEEAWFSVMIKPETTDGLFYGMSAVVSTVEGE